MKKLPRWLRWSLALLACVCFGLWCAGEVSQWVLRLRAEQMLADFRAIQLGQKVPAGLEAFFHKWGEKGQTGRHCESDVCTQWVAVSNWLPAFLIGDPIGKGPSGASAIVDFAGLRPTTVDVEIAEADGIVRNKWFTETIGTPMNAFRGYEVMLSVSSGENPADVESFSRYATTDHPFHWARWGAPAYLLRVEFRPEESEAERTALMNFQFSCITRITPCHNVEEILPEAVQLKSEIQNR